MKQNMQTKQVRVSSVIILRWLHDNITEVFKNLSQLYKKYEQKDLDVSRRVLHDKDLSTEFITSTCGIRKAAIE